MNNRRKQKERNRDRVHNPPTLRSSPPLITNSTSSLLGGRGEEYPLTFIYELGEGRIGREKSLKRKPTPVLRRQKGVVAKRIGR